MVAQLNDESMRFVVEGDGATEPGSAGPPNRSRGLVSCCIRKGGKYDHKRHHAKQGVQEMMKEWDFVLFRDDGSSLSLHPNFSNTKVAYKAGYSLLNDHEVPSTGLGGTDGRGTFKRFTTKGVERTLKFDARK